MLGQVWSERPDSCALPHQETANRWSIMSKGKEAQTRKKCRIWMISNHTIYIYIYFSGFRTFGGISCFAVANDQDKIVEQVPYMGYIKSLCVIKLFTFNIVRGRQCGIMKRTGDLEPEDSGSRPASATIFCGCGQVGFLWISVSFHW